MAVTAVISTHLEKVEPKLQVLYDKTDMTLASRIKPSKKVQPVNRYLYRIPLELFPAGAFHKYSANGSSLGRGSTLSTTHMTAGYIYATLAYEMTDEELDTTKGGAGAVIDVLNKALAEAIPVYQEHDNITLHTDGTGTLTADSTASAANSLTFTDTALGVNRLREGMEVDVWASGGATKRALAVGAPLLITRINYATGLVTFNQNVTAIATTDFLAFAGLDAYGPAALTSFSATWPPSPETSVAAGLGGDSFRHGLYYANDFTAANYHLGVQKSTVPQLLAEQVDASDALNFAHGLKLAEQLLQRMPEESIKGMRWVFHMKQIRQVFNIGMGSVNIDVNGGSFGRMPDLAPDRVDRSGTLTFAGFPVDVSKRQYNNRVDAWIPENWGRAVARDLSFYDDGNGGKIFKGRSITDGTVTSVNNFYVRAAMDFFCKNPGMGGAITNLDIPA
jgi:hypothetical protein